MANQEWISSDSAQHLSGAFPPHCGARPARCSASGRGFCWNWTTVTRKKSGVPCKTAIMSATRTWWMAGAPNFKMFLVGFNLFHFPSIKNPQASLLC